MGGKAEGKGKREGRGRKGKREKKSAVSESLGTLKGETLAQVLGPTSPPPSGATRPGHLVTHNLTEITPLTHRRGGRARVRLPQRGESGPGRLRMNDGASLNSAADKESRASGVKVRWSWVEWSEEREKERGIRGRQETPSTEWGDWYPWSPELERWRSEGSQRQTRWKERERKHPREMEHNRESPEPRVRQHDLQRTQPRREAQPDGWRRAGRRWSQMKGEKATKPGCQGTERSSVVGARAHVAESARRAVYERGGSGAQKEISQRASRGFQGPAYTEGTWRRGDGHPCARDCGSGVRKTAGKAATGAQHASRAPDDSSRNGGRPERLPSNRRVGAQGGSRPQVVPSQKSTMPSAQSVFEPHFMGGAVHAARNQDRRLPYPWRQTEGWSKKPLSGEAKVWSWKQCRSFSMRIWTEGPRKQQLRKAWQEIRAAHAEWRRTGGEQRVPTWKEPGVDGMPEVYLMFHLPTSKPYVGMAYRGAYQRLQTHWRARFRERDPCHLLMEKSAAPLEWVMWPNEQFPIVPIV